MKPRLVLFALFLAACRNDTPTTAPADAASQPDAAEPEGVSEPEAEVPITGSLPEPEDPYFVDLSGTLDGADDAKAAIRERLAEASEETRARLMIVVIDRMAEYPHLPQSILDFSSGLANEWAIAQEETGRGLVVVFAMDDGKYGIAKTPNLPVSLTQEISDAFSSKVVPQLGGQLGEAMETAAKVLVQSYIGHLEEADPTLLL